MDNVGVSIDNNSEVTELSRYLSPLAVWALSFGCAVGWGSFVMPGTTFLPDAGPVGTAIGIMVGAVVMFIIGMNYYYLMNRFQGAGGALTYTIEAFGYDHGFLSSWFLILVYIAIMWANASALTLIGRYLLGGMFEFGFHYRVLGYDVYMGEVFLSLTAIVVVGLVCMYGKKLAVGLQILFALLLFFGVVVCAVMIFAGGGGAPVELAPAFSEGNGSSISQIVTIVALSPWAFVGFEAISNSAAGFKFSVNKVKWILLASLITGAVTYILLSLMAASCKPDGYANWSAYISDLGSHSGIEGLPTFYAAHSAMGKAGVLILGIAATAAIITGLIGNYIAASRLLYTMSKDNILPKWFGRLNRDAVPANAILFLILISLLIPFLGRTALGWIVDVNTVGATIAYGYTSAAAYSCAKKEGNKRIQATGIFGLVMSVIFFFYFMSWSAGAMSTESYLILATWSILGFIYFRYVFSHDDDRRFGKSIIVWLGLLFLIFFTSLMWVKQATDEMTKNVVGNISEYYEARNPNTDPESVEATEKYLAEQLAHINRQLDRNSIIQMLLIMVSLAIMFSIYITVSKREKKMEAEKINAIESSKAKTVFLSNMSHDIRTPMNAIIGYITLAERENTTFEELKDYLSKIKGSSHHLLALINDVLEMSRIESGKMELEPIAVDIKKTIGEVKDLFATQMNEKNIDFNVDVSSIRNNLVYCDKNRLNRVLLNLISNAYKFTPEGGLVTVSAWEIACDDPGFGVYELRVKDSGIGMSPEFAAKVFEAFERERTSTVSGIQGTGLGMAITKSIIDLMGGTIEVQTAPDSGTEFIIKLRLELQEKNVGRDAAGNNEKSGDSESVKSQEDTLDNSHINDGDSEEKDGGISAGSTDDKRRTGENSNSGSVDGASAGEDTSADAASDNNGSRKLVADFSKMRLLLVEDMEINREIATMLLTGLGFAIETAENGQIAVDKVAASEHGYYDAVLMDIQMPVMNGYDAAKSIRELDDEVLSKIPIVAMTANAFSEDVKRAHDVGMNGHIAKPIDVNNMVSVLREVLG